MGSQKLRMCIQHELLVNFKLEVILYNDENKKSLQKKFFISCRAQHGPSAPMSSPSPAWLSPLPWVPFARVLART